MDKPDNNTQDPNLLLVDEPAAATTSESDAKKSATAKPSKILETGETKRQRRIVQSSALIGLEGPDPNDMRFMHAVLCQVGLPRSKVEGREFNRRSGAAWLKIQAGDLDEGNGPVPQPIPYGALPRLALASISTYAVRHKTREIPIGNSAADFLRELGMDTGGRRYATLRTQMHALAACRLQLGFKGRTFNGQPVEQFDAWSGNDSMQQSIWPGVMILSPGYYDSLIASAVPLDNRALMLLNGTALGLDMYVWLAQRLHRIDDSAVFLSWSMLKEDQFGQEYSGNDGNKSFRDEFKRILKLVLAAYPQARVEVVRGGIELRQSPPPIPYKK